MLSVQFKLNSGPDIWKALSFGRSTIEGAKGRIVSAVVFVVIVIAANAAMAISKIIILKKVKFVEACGVGK